MVDQKDTAVADYEVTTAREIGGLHRAKGEIIPMTPAQAKYYLPPYGTGLKPVAVKAAAKPKPDAAADAKSGKADA